MLSVMPARAATAIAALTVDCTDAKAMVQFYRDAFGGRADPDFPNLDCVRVDGLLILFRELDGWTRPTWPGSDIQMHLEIYVDNLRQAEARLVGLGAGRPAEQDPSDPDLVVLTDPAGHPFCIFERSTPDA
jgi:catechol 2,3-dioxygenase-like lactoylglutathione lyase family enzyme